jgi:hypothetical protein
MNFIKKYIALIIPVIIAVIAISIFIPALLIGSSLQDKMNKTSISRGTKIKSILRGNVPPEKQYEQEKLYQEEFTAEADAIAKVLDESSRRLLLDYGIFPDQRDGSRQLFLDFGKKFRDGIAGPGGLLKRMKALDSPSDSEFRRETERRGSTSNRRVTRSSRSKSSSNAIMDAVCRKRAESITIYSNPQVFPWYDFWEEYDYVGQDVALEDCWYTQVAYWVYQDVIDTIVAMNAGASSVYDSPVKRFYGFGFQVLIDEPGSSKGNRSVISDKPYYILEDSDKVLGVAPWTGRKTDDNYDVIHFNFGIVINTKTMMSFIQALCSEKEHQYREGFVSSGTLKTAKHNQITVLMQEMRPLDRESKPHADYRYGDDGVASLFLVCEYVFDRTGYDSLKPTPIKELLNQGENKSESEASYVY